MQGFWHLRKMSYRIREPHSFLRLVFHPMGESCEAGNVPQIVTTGGGWVADLPAAIQTAGSVFRDHFTASTDSNQKHKNSHLPQKSSATFPKKLCPAAKV
jgi:hypothetical protein